MAKKSTFKPKQKKSEISQEAARQRKRKSIRDWGIALVVLLAVGIFGYTYIRNASAEHDLSQIGQGKPMVVQVHDIHCSTCVVLQGQTRRALRSFKHDELGYVIADLNKVDGRHYAGVNRAGRTTLLLTDKRGNIRNRVHGETEPERLKEIFAEHIRRYGG